MNDIGVYKLRYHSFFPHFALNSYRIEFCCHVCRIKYEITRVLCKVSENDVDISWFMLCLPLLLLGIDLRCILFSIKIKSGHSVGVCCCCIHCCRHHIAHRWWWSLDVRVRFHASPLDYIQITQGICLLSCTLYSVHTSQYIYYLF